MMYDISSSNTLNNSNNKNTEGPRNDDIYSTICGAGLIGLEICMQQYIFN